jgi:hypothetical protein
MLPITIPANELWDERKQEFIQFKEQKLLLEHSLVSLSKWESKWNKAFLGKQPKTVEETLDYIKCMTLTQNVNPDVYRNITNDNIEEINRYIEAPMTATVFTKNVNSRMNREVVTSELIYYWMITLNIPFECQKWHLNRLLTLIRVCNVKNTPPKKMSKRSIMSQNAALNAARRKQLNSNG